MKVGIIGAGFTGLAAAYELSKCGHKVTLFEKNQQSGGLAIGFKNKNWQWSLEDHYHHLFTSDESILNLAKEVGHQINFSFPKTSTWLDGQITQLDSPLSLLKFTPLSIVSRIRTGVGLSILKYNPIWKPFEYFTAKKYITTIMGQESWKKLWHPLFKGKFGVYADIVSAAWFWSRIYKRSQALGYPEKGFQELVKSIEEATKKYGTKFQFGVQVKKIVTKNKRVEIHVGTMREVFDKVICTLPTRQFISLVEGLNQEYVEKYSKLKGLGAINLVIELNNKFFSDDTYWLNINDDSMPFLAVVEHTNFIDSIHYGNKHVLYIGNYLPQDHKFFSYTPEQLFDVFLPHLQKINQKIDKNSVTNIWMKKAMFAQPVVGVRYSKLIPPIKTPLENIYLANIQQVYPWDRGTNYAVELGRKVARLCMEKSDQ